MQRTPEQQLRLFKTAVAEEISALQFSNPPFELRIGLASSYDQLFRGEIETEAEAEVLSRTMRQGRVILVGRGGGGKTQLLLRMMRSSRERGILPVLIDLKNWKQSDYLTWNETVAKDIAYGAAFLIERFSRPQIRAIELDWLPPTTSKILIVDGLNEIAASVGAQVLRSLDEFVSDQILTSLIVSDRLVRRELPTPARWALGMVLPLSNAQIERYGGSHLAQQQNAALLDLPFFLDAAMRDGRISRSGAQTHEQFLKSHVGLTDQDLDLAGSAAFRAYFNKTRSFQIAEFLRVAGQAVTERLQNSGAIQLAETGEAHFAHHLLHDFLASRHMAKQPYEFWNSTNLNVISLDGSSFDPLALVFEQLNQDRADDFLRRIYDWNLYAAGYTLGTVSANEVPCSSEMQIVIFAMLAEKRFDLVEATRQRANDALLLIGLHGAQPFRDAASFEQVLESVTAVRSEVAWFVNWQRLFTRPSGQGLSDEDIRMLLTDDSVGGWTMANVARRMIPTKQQFEILRNTLQNAGSTQRWRVAHLLGAFPSSANFDALLQTLDNDLDGSVRYGAARSLAELACRGGAHLSNKIVKVVNSRVDKLRADPKVRDELARALVVIPEAAPAGWGAVVADVGRSFFQWAEAPESRDRWRRYITDAESHYAGPVPARAN